MHNGTSQQCSAQAKICTKRSLWHGDPCHSSRELATVLVALLAPVVLTVLYWTAFQQSLVRSNTRSGNFTDKLEHLICCKFTSRWLLSLSPDWRWSNTTGYGHQCDQRGNRYYQTSPVFLFKNNVCTNHYTSGALPSQQELLQSTQFTSLPEQDWFSKSRCAAISR